MQGDFDKEDAFSNKLQNYCSLDSATGMMETVGGERIVVMPSKLVVGKDGGDLIKSFDMESIEAITQSREQEASDSGLGLMLLGGLFVGGGVLGMTSGAGGTGTEVALFFGILLLCGGGLSFMLGGQTGKFNLKFSTAYEVSEVTVTEAEVEKVVRIVEEEWK